MTETYPYEQLDPKRFQRLVQALLTAELPDIECFPISGADGGRDAVLSVEQDSKLAGSFIYQIKFKEQQPLGVPRKADLYRWLTRELTGEIEKVEKLKERGATKYTVISNIPGSGGLDSGLRDEMKRWAENNLPLPTAFWWREDLDARLIRHKDLIFRFNLFTGPEAVRAWFDAIYAGGQAGDSVLRRSETPTTVLALMAYLSEQYRLEAKLRFEQADISGSPLLDLFVDVPVVGTSVTKKSDLGNWMINRAAILSGYPISAGELRNSANRRFFTHQTLEKLGMGGSDFFLTDEPPKTALRIVLEGAPGQGKSTLGQYVCQVHRIRLLSKNGDHSKLSPQHAYAPVRLPIRIEFRHLATWFRKSNPWTSESTSSVQEPDYWAETLESFVAAHVRQASGMEFTPTDLVALLAETPSFIFLDGLDEVADVQLRRTLVESVERSINRLEDLGADMQVLVTTRPAFFLKAPSFSEKGFDYLRLVSLTRALIEEYAKKWITIRDIPEDRATEILQVLLTSISQTHVIELARNPMQLAILLWLISIKGRSLPDQRTALYDQYLTAFLDREATKNTTVRTHRARLLELHGYLGWLLHGRAESGDPRYAAGDVTADELRSLIRAYLEREERPSELVAEMFEGAERVFVLVSRIEGRFEFEVQPLREFFAARYLYKTAPHSTSADPARGTRPDRLEQLIRNPYWLNVARFFCGWYDKGELADLTRHLKDLCEDSQYKYLGYPRYIIAYILQDCTTAESQRDTRELVTAMSDNLGLRLLTSRYSSWDSNANSALLPNDCGQELYADQIREALLSCSSEERRLDLVKAIRMNDSAQSRTEWWLSTKDSLERSYWLLIGTEIGAISCISLDMALEIFDPESSTRLDWIRCVESGRFDVGLNDDARYAPFCEALADAHSPLNFSVFSPKGSRLAHYGEVFSIMRLATGPRIDPKWSMGSSIKDDSVSHVSDRFAALERLVTAAIGDGSGYKSRFGRIVSAIDAVQDAFGECWLGWQLALLGAKMSRRRPKGISFTDPSHSISDRARMAKLSASDAAFWSKAISDATNQGLGVRKAVFTAAFSWADPTVLRDLLPAMVAPWNSFTYYDIRSIKDTVMNLNGTLTGSLPKTVSESDVRKVSSIPPSLMCMLYFRTADDADPTLLRKIEKSFEQTLDPTEAALNGIVASTLLHGYIRYWQNSAAWRSQLLKISNFYRMIRKGTLLNPDRGVPSISDKYRDGFFRTILANADDYPGGLLSLADNYGSGEMAKSLRPLREIAREEKWFEGLPD